MYKQDQRVDDQDHQEQAPEKKEGKLAILFLSIVLVIFGYTAIRGMFSGSLDLKGRAAEITEDPVVTEQKQINAEMEAELSAIDNQMIVLEAQKNDMQAAVEHGKNHLRRIVAGEETEAKDFSDQRAEVIEETPEDFQ